MKTEEELLMSVFQSSFVSQPALWLSSCSPVQRAHAHGTAPEPPQASSCPWRAGLEGDNCDVLTREPP